VLTEGQSVFNPAQGEQKGGVWGGLAQGIYVGLLAAFGAAVYAAFSLYGRKQATLEGTEQNTGEMQVPENTVSVPMVVLGREMSLREGMEMAKYAITHPDEQINDYLNQYNYETANYMANIQIQQTPQPLYLQDLKVTQTVPYYEYQYSKTEDFRPTVLRDSAEINKEGTLSIEEANRKAYEQMMLKYGGYPEAPQQYIKTEDIANLGIGGCIDFSKKPDLGNAGWCIFDGITLLPGGWIVKPLKSVKIVGKLLEVSKGLKVLEGITKEMKLGGIAAKYVGKADEIIAKVVTRYGDEITVKASDIQHIIRETGDHSYMREATLEQVISTLQSGERILKNDVVRYYKYFADAPAGGNKYIVVSIKDKLSSWVRPTIP
jgi:hypothetical protein